MTVEVPRAGIHTAVQDLGRPGFRQFGVSAGGVLDPIAARTANLLVGNEESAAVLETAFGGLRIRFTDARIAAWCGASFEVRRESDIVPPGRVFAGQAGDELSFHGPAEGMRAWIAISGGIDVPVELRSRSTDIRGSFGGHEGRCLRDGDLLPLGVETRDTANIRKTLSGTGLASWGANTELCQRGISRPVLRVIRGQEWARFDMATHRGFFEQSFEITPASDRMGLRLAGTPLAFLGVHAEMVSQGIMPGTIQVPRDGQPIVLLADCQTVGGYPRIAHVITADLSLAAQLRPGDKVSFREVSLDEARALIAAQEKAVETLRIGVRLRSA
jgi:antagonist of KipI